MKLVMTGFGMIWDMDWLSYYGAMLNGKKRIVALELESGKPCDN